MSSPNAEVPYGTLDLLVLKTLETMGPMNGCRIARRIEQLEAVKKCWGQSAAAFALVDSKEPREGRL